MVEAIQSAFSGAITEEMSEADRKAAYEKLIESSKKDLKDNFKEEDITISFEKTDNGWKIKEGDEALANIMTANFVGAMKNMMEDIGDSFGDIGDTSECKANISQSGQLTQNGVLLKVKNENSVAVSHITADVMFENEAGEMIQMGTGFLDLLEAGEEAYVPVSYFGDKAPAKYSATISCDVNDSYTDAKSQVTVEHNDGADSVLAKVTNNSGHTLSGISAVVLYYSGDQLIGFEEENAYNVNDGKTEMMEFYHPMDLNYEDLAYDRYELALFSAYYMD